VHRSPIHLDVASLVGHPSGVTAKRPTNWERRLQELEEAEQRVQGKERGILEIFERDEDAPIARDTDEPAERD